jgi:signal peptidase I
MLLGWACLLLSLFAVCDALSSREENSRLSEWWILAGLPLIYLGFNIIFTSLLLASGFRALRFTSTAMEPTMSPGDKFIYDVNYYRGQQGRRGELVVMRLEDALTVKRIAATNGDAIRGKDRRISVNGEVQSEPFIQHTLPIGSNPQLDTFGPIIVPAGEFFVLGDNRDISRDSRSPDFGPVGRQSIVGKPLYIYRLPWEAQHWEKLR